MNKEIRNLYNSFIVKIVLLDTSAKLLSLFIYLNGRFICRQFILYRIFSLTITEGDWAGTKHRSKWGVKIKSFLQTRLSIKYGGSRKVGRTRWIIESGGSRLQHCSQVLGRVSNWVLTFRTTKYRVVKHGTSHVVASILLLEFP